MNVQLTPALLAKPLVAAFVLAGLVTLLMGWRAGLAALAGGLIAWLSQVYFAKRLQSKWLQADDKGFMRTFYRAEARKLLLAVILFIPVIALAKAPGLPLLGSYALIQTGWMFWLLRQKDLHLMRLQP